MTTLQRGAAVETPTRRPCRVSRTRTNTCDHRSYLTVHRGVRPTPSNAQLESVVATQLSRLIARSTSSLTSEPSLNVNSL